MLPFFLVKNLEYLTIMSKFRVYNNTDMSNTLQHEIQTLQREIKLIREAKKEAAEIVMKHIMLEITNAKTKSHLTLMELGAIYKDLEEKHSNIESV